MQLDGKALTPCAPGPGLQLQHHKGREKGESVKCFMGEGTVFPTKYSVLNKENPLLADRIRNTHRCVSPCKDYLREQFCDVWIS